MFHPELYAERRSKLRAEVGSGLIVITGNGDVPVNYLGNPYKFRQDSTFLYFFGIDTQGLNAVLDCDLGRDIIFGDELTMDDIVWMGPQKKLKDKALECGVDTVMTAQLFSDYLRKAREKKQPIHLLPAYRAENKIVLAEILQCYPAQLSYYVSEKLIKACVKLRSIKDVYEIREIEQQMDMAYQMHTTAMRMANPGVFEHEIAGAIEGLALGANGMVSFPVILTKNGKTLHNHYHGNQLQAGDLMLVDAGCESVRHYATDHTRTSPVSGKFTQQQREIYEIVLSANNISTQAAKPGVYYRDCHLLAAKTIAAGLMELGIMQGNVEEAVQAGAHALFFPHGLGHMMGLDVHDMEDYGEDFVGYDENVQRSTQFGTRNLRLGRALQENFVITNEPGIYFIPELIDQWKAENINSEFINYSKLEAYRNFGGIRLEDDLLITSTGARNLGKRIPITIDEVEAMCATK